MPQLDSEVIKRVIAAHDPASPAIIVPTSDGKRGHPVLFPWTLASAVASLTEIEGVNALLNRFPVREITCGSSEIHGDLDTPGDYDRMRGQVDRSTDVL
jgi:molybdenum cofactor cytidylyltransferase